MPRTDTRIAALTLLATLAASLMLAGCSEAKKAGNSIEVRDMEVVDGTVNDSMTDLDAVKADGVGNVENAGNVSRPAVRKQDNAGEDAETVATD